MAMADVDGSPVGERPAEVEAAFTSDEPRNPLGLTVVLVEPRIPQNTGNIARLCACVGAELYLVGDLGFQLDNKYYERASMDYRDHAEIVHVPTWDALVEAHPGVTPYYVETTARQLHTDIIYPRPSLLVFGSETTGLPSWVTEKYPDQSVRLPMRPGRRSLNLSNSVSVMVYEVLRQELAGLRGGDYPGGAIWS